MGGGVGKNPAVDDNPHVAAHPAAGPPKPDNDQGIGADS
jgi:hypothetical protein